MPSVYNGCGTWYYGKRNPEQYISTCRYCGHTATLKSYDTTLFIVVVFVPIIPLARKRIIEQCPACKRHSAAPLKLWRAARDRLSVTIAAYDRAPADADLARQALQSAVAFRELTAFTTLAPRIEEHLSHDTGMLLMLSRTGCEPGGSRAARAASWQSFRAARPGG